jgi:2Fe-2S ferredoxin
MHLKHSGREHGPPVIPVTFVLEDPIGLTGKDIPKYTLMGGTGESILELAMEHGINIEHACGGVCACSTCHVYIEQGEGAISEATEAEDDRVEEAAGLQRNSRLSCQCVLERNVPVTVRVPAWNRNAVKEVPH